MSKVLKKGYAGRYWCDIVQTESGSIYIVDSGLMVDRKLKTRLFRYDQEADRSTFCTEFNNTCYKSMDELRAGHDDICSNLEHYIGVSSSRG